MGNVVSLAFLKPSNRTSSSSLSRPDLCGKEGEVKDQEFVVREGIWGWERSCVAATGVEVKAARARGCAADRDLCVGTQVWGGSAGRKPYRSW